MTRGKTVKSWAMMTAACMALGAPMFGVVIPVTTAKADASAAAPLAQVRYFRIAQQDLVAALNEFGRQSGRDILFSTEVASRKRSAPVDGPMTAEQALRMLLSGTGLTFRATSERTFLVEFAAAAPQAPAPDQPADARDQPTDDDKKKTEDDGKVERVVVTGSLIKGQQNGASPTIILSREDLERSGEPTVARALRQLPQNFSGNSDLLDVDPRGTNLNRGAGVNLRGLGIDSTLVLINGHRLAKGGAGAAYSDISSIPAIAIERVEIVTDGASATYGADAIGGVVNLILRKDFDGAEIRGRYGVTTESGYDETTAGLAWGTAWDTGSLFASFEYHEQSGLSVSERDFVSGGNFTSQGGSDFRLGVSPSPFSKPGNMRAVDGFLDNPGIATPAGTFVPIPSLPAGQLLAPANLALGPLNRFYNASSQSLVPEQDRDSAYVSGRQQLAPWLEVFGDFVAARRENFSTLAYTQALSAVVPATNPLNPFGEAVQVFYVVTELGAPTSRSTTDAIGGTAGFNAEFGTWSGEVSFTYGREELIQQTRGLLNAGAAIARLNDPSPARTLYLFGDGSFNSPAVLALIENINNFRSETHYREANAVLNGELDLGFSEPWLLALGYQHRETDINTRQIGTNVNTVLVNTGAKGSDETDAAFAELLLPLVHDAPIADTLEVTVAGRVEDTSAGEVLSPKVGLVWAPVSSLRFRTSWGTSFKPPQVRDRVEPSFVSGTTVLPIPDPKIGGQPIVNLVQGGNPDLQPEEAETLNVGFVYEPDFLSGMRLSADHFRISYTDRIVQIVGFSTTFLLQNEDALPGVIVRAPSVGNTPGQILAIDFRPRNFTLVEARGVDLRADYSWASDWGNFNVGANATFFSKFDSQATAVSPLLHLVDTQGSPPDWRASFRTQWSLDEWTVGANLNYTDNYAASTAANARQVGSYTTVDLRASYIVPETSMFSGISLVVGANNAFDTQPSFFNTATGFDPRVADPRNRVVYFQISQRW